MKKILITGVAGFIGFHLAKKLLKKKSIVIVGIDNLNNYYDQKLKSDRLSILKRNNSNFIFKKIDIRDKKKINKLFLINKFDKVIHLAAQAGVRHVRKNPDSYFDNNVLGFYNILEAARVNKIKHLISASTSSVYGINKKKPFDVNLPADHPTQFYAASKRSNELMAHSYSYMFKLPVSIIRFFTAYGPWGRPDMALYIFVKSIINNKKFNLFNYGNHSRDFTYIDDIIKGIILTMNKVPVMDKKWHLKSKNSSTSHAPFKILNLGNGTKVLLKKYLSIIEKILKKKGKVNLVGFQAGDLKDSLSDTRDTKKYLNFSPNTNIEYGIKKFVEWYLEYNSKSK